VKTKLYGDEKSEQYEQSETGNAHPSRPPEFIHDLRYHWMTQYKVQPCVIVNFCIWKFSVCVLICRLKRLKQQWEAANRQKTDNEIANRKSTNNDLQNTTRKTKHWTKWNNAGSLVLYIHMLFQLIFVIKWIILPWVCHQHRHCAVTLYPWCPSVH
jgi:hypothetical protein